MSELLERHCTRTGCNVATDGICAEGIQPVVDCPHLQPSAGEGPSGHAVAAEPHPQGLPVIPSSADGTQVDDQPTMLELPDGMPLSLRSASDIARASYTNVIIVAGGAECGKTTLVASIFEKFQRGPLAGFNFAGSLTLPAFERRCHHSRIASRRVEPTTERTVGLEDTFLHLRVRAQDEGSEPQDLLFSDLAGERFRLARDSTDECRKMQVLRRTDHFVLLLDCARLSVSAQRQEAFVDGRVLLRSCVDSGMLGNCSFVDVLLAKWDLVEERKGDKGLFTFIEKVRGTILNEFSNRVGRLRFFEIAARPASSVLPFAYNLEMCFPSWVTDSPRRTYYVRNATLGPGTPREIDRYSPRHAPRRLAYDQRT